MVKLASLQILIEGTPGVGKTTFAWHMCCKWEEEELFQQWSVVVMLQFRDERILQAKSLKDLFYHPKPWAKLLSMKLRKLEQGRGVLLIFNGLTNSPRVSYWKTAYLDNSLKRVIPEAAIMITSQSLVTGRLVSSRKV